MKEEKNIYYVPEFEEFAIGLEYEFFTHDKWIKSEIIGSCGEILNDMEDWEMYDQKRIKVLDKNDIIDSGWILHHDHSAMDIHENIISIFEKGKYILKMYEDNLIKPFIVIQQQYVNVLYEGYFSGTINNKLEFIKLEKQLNIQ